MAYPTLKQVKPKLKTAIRPSIVNSMMNRVIKKNDSVVNNTFVKMMEALGYDIELHYVKRDE